MLHNFTFFRFHRISDTFLYRPYYDKQREWKRINSFASTGQAVQNPFTFYYIRSDDWNDSHNFQFWNKNFSTNTDPGITNTATLKTVYDPSVSGFTLPTTAAFTGFTKTGDITTNKSEFNVSGNFNNGWYFYTNGWKNGGTIFFEINIGARDTSSSRPTGTGAVVFVGDTGNYWNSGASSKSTGREFGYTSGLLVPQDSGLRSYGYPIRSVSE